MKKLLLGISLIMAARAAPPGAEIGYWIEPCTNPRTGCVAGDEELAKWALEAWQQASGGKIRFVAAAQDQARVVVEWSEPTAGLYGEMVPIRVNGKPGALLNITIADGGTRDKLMHDTVVYLTCLHEAGHALGLEHTSAFADIMYSFQYGGDIPEYFMRYRRKLSAREDIRRNAGLSDADRERLVKNLEK